MLERLLRPPLDKRGDAVDAVGPDATCVVFWQMVEVFGGVKTGGKPITIPDENGSCACLVHPG